MKKANIYEVTINDNGKKVQITCVATDIPHCVDTVAPKDYNPETQELYYTKYKETDILSIVSIKNDVIVQNYINDITD